MAVIPALLAIPGINVLLWGSVSVIRYFTESVNSVNDSTAEAKLTDYMKKNSTAILIAARNEERTIGKTIDALKSQVPGKNIYVISDGSSDKTVSVCRQKKVRIFSNTKSMGKAKSLVRLMEKFNLLERYPFILYADADIILNDKFLAKALPKFADGEISAVTGHAEVDWRNINFFSMESFIKAYRHRLYSILQFTIRYGQTSKYMNSTPVAPGFAVLYRSSVLRKIDLATEGLIIEDFNTAFQIYKKRLGKIYYHPNIWAYGNEPLNFRDYIHQVNRWNLGFWQTLIKHRLWASLFSFATLLFLTETLFVAFIIYLLPVTVLLVTVKYFPDLFANNIVTISNSLNIYLTPKLLFIGFFFLDYFVTALVAILIRKPALFFYGTGFIFFRFIDSVIILSSMAQAVMTKSSGIWISPVRRA